MSKPTQPKIQIQPCGVFFDLYGTLLLFGDMKAAWSDWLDAFYSALCPHGLPLSKATFGERCDCFFGREEPAASNGGLTVFERRIQSLAETLGLKVRPEEIKAMAPGIVGAWQKHIRPDPDATEALSALAKTKTLGLISNFDHPPHVYQVLKGQGLNSYFKTIVISGEVGFKKPDPRIFRHALEETRLSPEEAVYVGDTEEDVQGAKGAGMTPILIARSETGTDPGLLDYTKDNASRVSWPATRTHPVATIAHLRELIEVIT